MPSRSGARSWLLAPLVGALLLTGCTSDPDPAPEPSASSSETLTPPADLGDVTVEGTVLLSGDTARLTGTLHNNSPDEIGVTGVSCACASGIRLGTLDDQGSFVPLSGAVPVPAGDSLTFGGDGEVQVELTGLLSTTVPDAVVPVMAFLADRNPVQGVATVQGG